MPKIHKTPIGIRPIIPSHSWYTTCAAKYLHRKLYPILKKFKWVITDRLELIQEIEQKKFDSSTVKLATIDVTALYTSIDLEKGLNLVAILLKNHVEDFQIPFYIDLMRWVLTNNYFQFKGNWYQQIKGAAMGGNASGIFADLVLVALERDILPKVPKEHKAFLYRRYRDDILIAVDTIKSAKAITDHLNGSNMLSFNMEQFGDKVNFLDITISLGQKFSIKRQLDMKPFRKPTSNSLFTHYATYKPETTKTSWITGEQIRMLRACQTENIFRSAMLKFQTSLLKSGYPKKIIRSQCKYKFADRNWLIEKTEKSDQVWYSLDNSRMAHEKWNFIQNNFKPLLKFHNVQITAKKGSTTMDALNVAAKSMLRASSDESEKAARQLDLANCRDKRYLSTFKKGLKRRSLKETIPIEASRSQRLDTDYTAPIISESMSASTRYTSKRGRSTIVETAACEKIPPRSRNHTSSRAPSTRSPPRKKRATNAAA
jgi:hypothetical protein